MSFTNIIKSLFDKKKTKVILEKIFIRFFDDKGSLNQEDLENWLKENESELSSFCKKQSGALWRKSLKISKKIESFSKQKLSKIKIDLGGGGAYPLLIFLTLKYKPKNIVETGVGAGFSSYAFLEGIKENRLGKLYSSDFPYFRVSGAEKFIGYLVPNHLRKNWHLYTEGDQKNLKKILKNIKKINLFHYDSDKSYYGRRRTLNKIKFYLDRKSWIVMDDVQNNSYFFDLINEEKKRYWKIFNFKGKWVGVICPKKI